jgi:hypothetical protein
MFICRRFAFPSLLVCFLLIACGGNSPTDPPAGRLIVGIQADNFGTLVNAVHVVVTTAGRVSHDKLWPVVPNASPFAMELPIEGGLGESQRIVAEALNSQSGSASRVVVSHTVRSTLPPASVPKLLRVVLERRCVTFTSFSGAAPTATCAGSTTCAAGRCVDPETTVLPLEDYEAGWATSPPDACRPAGHGAPELELGTGQTDFGPLAKDHVLSLERGPQGGHHIWLATRMKNLRQTGSRTLLEAKVVDDPTLSIAPAAFVFTYEPDEGNACKLWGLRFQLDAGAGDLATAYKRFLGKTLDVTATVVDSTNARAVATTRVRIAADLLCPDGTTTSCKATTEDAP